MECDRWDLMAPAPQEPPANPPRLERTPSSTVVDHVFVHGQAAVGQMVYMSADGNIATADPQFDKVIGVVTDVNNCWAKVEFVHSEEVQRMAHMMEILKPSAYDFTLTTYGNAAYLSGLKPAVPSHGIDDHA